MAIQFIVEDGTGVASANSYIAIADADQYAENTGRLPAWTAAGADLQQTSLIRAAQWLDETYRDRYKGRLPDDTGETQGLLWPRVDVVNPRTHVVITDKLLPENIGQAAVELALVLIAEGNAGLHVAPSTGTPTVKEKAVRVEGAVSKSEVFAGSGSLPAIRKFPAALALLKPYLNPSLAGLVTRV